MTILDDATENNRPFLWNGPIPPDELDEWLKARDLSLPDDVVHFWHETGGGTVFESETILGPYGDDIFEEDIGSVNDCHRGLGMPDVYLIIHDGCMGLTAIRRSDLKYVMLDGDTYAETAVYSTFDDWYTHTIRKEFAKRYGLK